ncbi:MAG TPA: hypothetical protein ENK18_02480 [Deltaproteobacteria bacterium]|nr:hypothetical protein [Deltaproteobacteria bacterium]
MPGYNVANALRGHATERPGAIAIKFPARSYTTATPTWDAWTFAQLDQQSDAYARGFAAAGITAGDRTTVLFRPSLELYAVLFALFKLGAVPVLLDPGMGLRPVLACIERTRPRVVIAMPVVHAVRTFARRPFASAEILITVGRRWFWGGTTLAACDQPGPEPFPIVSCDAADDAAILFTSGSTGSAKGVASKQAMFAAQVEALRQMFDLEPGQIDQQAFAAFAIFDICLGMTSVIPKMDLSRPATARPEDIVAAIQANAPDVAFASPIVWQNTTRYCQQTNTRLDPLQTVLTVGAPIPADLHRRFMELLPTGAQVYTPYGATEGMPISWIGSEEILGDSDSDSDSEGTWSQTARGWGTCVGRIAPGAWVRIIEIHDDPIPTWSDELALPSGQLGEIVVGGDQVSPEYKDVPEANVEAKITDGARVLHRMGDLGYLDADDRLWFCGRKAHRLQTTAGIVPPVPVEGIYNEDPDVFRTALVGVGPVGAEVPVLCVEMEPGNVYGPHVEARLRALGQGTRYEGLVKRFLPHPGFPTDARHNSKIRREDLKPWAEARCGDLVKPAP